MIDALVAGKLIQTPTSRTGASGKPFTNFLLSVSVGDDQPVVVSGIAFSEAAEKIARLQKGDPLAVVGSLKPSSWLDKSSQEPRHGLSITVNQSLSPYDIKKRRAATLKDDAAGSPASGHSPKAYNDELDF
jgi:single-stranded DNA-binding protein